VRYETLSSELEAWVAEGLVTEAQADAIRSRYAKRRAPERRDRLVSALAVIGAAVGGLGVILFFAANWDAIPRPARVALLLATMLAAHVGGERLRATRPAVAQALLLLGSVVFGASLFLVGQMYHVQAHDPLAFLVWTAAAAPIALVARTRPLAVLSILTFGAWMVYELVELGGEAYEYVPVVGAVYGAALYAWGRLWRDELFAAPMRGLGYAVAALGTFAFTFQAAVDELDRNGRLETAELVAFLALGGAAVAGAVLLALRARGRADLAEAACVLAVPALVALAVLAPEAEPALVYPILFNLLLAAIALGAVALGYLREQPWLVNAGIALVAVDVFARYVDVFWELLPRSLGFLGAGLVLLALAFVLERQRARLVRGMGT
jgi:uncharacterized membrane protein